MRKSPAANSPENKHLRFVKERLKRTNFFAAEKIRRIDELADIIFTARRNYRAGKNT